MDFYSDKNKIKDSVENKTVAIATYDEGAEIIAKALNYYFGDTYTRNQVVEMMNANTSCAFKSVTQFIKKNRIDSDSIIEMLLGISEELAAQAIVVSLRDELKFDKPK